MSKANLFYAQSGGVTSVINASACGVIETARLHKDTIGKVYAGLNGILGALNEDLIDTSRETKKTIAALRSTPAGAFGSCRYKLKSYSDNQREYERLMEVFQAHNIRYFLYNGGGDSQDTANKVSQLSLEQGFPITCIGIPKTVDNDLPITDNCPGFGSVAKYVAVSIREAGLGSRVMIAQFLKGGVDQGPQGALKLCGNLTWIRPAIQSCIPLYREQREQQDQFQVEIEAVESIWEICKKHLINGDLDQLVLDEIGLAISLGYLNQEIVMSVLEKRPRTMDIILTGPSIPEQITTMADQVTELRCGL